MSALREKVLLQMRLRGFSPSTVEAYIYALEQLWQFHRRPLERLSCEEVQRFLDEVITVRQRAWATVIRARCTTPQPRTPPPPSPFAPRRASNACRSHLLPGHRFTP